MKSLLIKNNIVVFLNTLPTKKMFLKHLVLLFFILNSCQKTNQTLEITFTGDVILDRGVADEIQIHGDTTLVNSIKRFSAKDLLIINLEGTLGMMDSIQNDSFNFNSPSEFAILLKNAGVTFASVSNNHAFDNGLQGFEQTIQNLKKGGIGVLGEGCNVTIISNKKNKIGVLSASLTSHNKSYCLNTKEKIFEAIHDFNQLNPEIPLVLYLHWGLELQPKVEKWQKIFARNAVEKGADLIIGHHPHVIQNMEYIEDVPVFYSIGNFIADAYLPETDKGLLVNVVLNKNIFQINLIPVILENYFPNKVDLKTQLEIFRNLLKYSENVCIYKLKNEWKIKPTRELNFEEGSDLWLFSKKNTVAIIKKIREKSFVLYASQSKQKTNFINLHGMLSEAEIADINNDGNPDILIGISKKVHFDPKENKRLNIFTIENNKIKTLWLGTKFLGKLVNFETIEIDGLNYLKTTEADENGNHHTRIYEWDSFGFALKMETK
jgi:hypothetical protein